MFDLEEVLENNKPKIASACPFRVHLEKDKIYYYCTCGLSKLQVFTNYKLNSNT